MNKRRSDCLNSTSLFHSTQNENGKHVIQYKRAYYDVINIMIPYTMTRYKSSYGEHMRIHSLYHSHENNEIGGGDRWSYYSNFLMNSSPSNQIFHSHIYIQYILSSFYKNQTGLKKKLPHSQIYKNKITWNYWIAFIFIAIAIIRAVRMKKKIPDSQFWYIGK